MQIHYKTANPAVLHSVLQCFLKNAK